MLLAESTRLLSRGFRRRPRGLAERNKTPPGVRSHPREEGSPAPRKTGSFFSDALPAWCSDQEPAAFSVGDALGLNPTSFFPADITKHPTQPKLFMLTKRCSPHLSEEQPSTNSPRLTSIGAVVHGVTKQQPSLDGWFLEFIKSMTSTGVDGKRPAEPNRKLSKSSRTLFPT